MGGCLLVKYVRKCVCVCVWNWERGREPLCDVTNNFLSVFPFLLSLCKSQKGPLFILLCILSHSFISHLSPPFLSFYLFYFKRVSPIRAESFRLFSTFSSFFFFLFLFFFFYLFRGPCLSIEASRVPFRKEREIKIKWKWKSLKKRKKKNECVLQLNMKKINIKI